MGTNVYFGNLSIKDFEYRTGWNFSKEDKDFLEKYRTNSANEIKSGFHIFDIPFCILCSEDISKELLDILTKYENENKSKENMFVGLI